MATGDPTGADLTSGTTNGNTLPVSPSTEEREITFGVPVELTSGVKYAIVIKALSGDNSNLVRWWRKDTDVYAGGNQTTTLNAGSSWVPTVTADFWFATKASGVEKDTQKTNDASTASTWGASVWQAQTFTASSTYTISSVVLKLSRALSPGTVTVSIKATVGAPTKATNPSPTDANASVTLDQATISWDDGGGADTFNVYYGTTSGSLSLVSSTQAGTSFTVTGITNGSPYSYLSTRYWRIDSTNGAGTTTGDEWSFTTIRLDPPSQTYFYPATGQRYYLLVQSDGSYGNPPGVGVENTDFVYLAAGYEFNAISTTRKLVSCANSKVWFEDI